jgi:hypothetical protein
MMLSVLVVRMIAGKTDFSASSQDSQALHIPDPLSITTETSSIYFKNYKLNLNI